MWYNLKNPLEIDKFMDRVTELRNKGAVVELTEKRARSLQANKYLHLMLSKFALEYGYTLDEVKTHFYKVTVNPDIYIRERVDKFSGEIYKYVRSSAELTSDEMSKSIEAFREFWLEEGGYRFPPSDEYIALLHIQHDVENASKEFLT